MDSSKNTYDGMNNSPDKIAEGEDIQRRYRDKRLLLANMSADERRLLAEWEARADYKKGFLHLLSDIHDELIAPDRSVEGAMLHANKRLASLNAKAAWGAHLANIENSELQAEVKHMSEESLNLTREASKIAATSLEIAQASLAVSERSKRISEIGAFFAIIATLLTVAGLVLQYQAWKNPVAAPVPPLAAGAAEVTETIEPTSPAPEKAPLLPSEPAAAVKPVDLSPSAAQGPPPQAQPQSQTSTLERQ